MSYLGALGAPAFYDQSGREVAAVNCGSAYTFNVSGYSQVWLKQWKNGQPGYNGPLAVPMNPYIANCTTEVGVYYNEVYTIVGGQQGAMIGSVTFTVQPSPTGGQTTSTGPNVTVTARGFPPTPGPPIQTTSPGSPGGGPVPGDPGPGPGDGTPPPPAPAQDNTMVYALLGLVGLALISRR